MKESKLSSKQKTTLDKEKKSNQQKQSITDDLLSRNPRLEMREQLHKYSTAKTKLCSAFSKAAAAVTGVSSAVGAGQAMGTLGAVAQVLGFGSGGIAAGSTAASMMSAAATSGIGGSAIAALQSAGALFTGSVAASLVAPVAVGGTVGGALYYYCAK